MDDPTSLLFGLESLRVADVVRVADRVVRVVVETVDQQGICPDCGMASSRVKDRPFVRIRDLPIADQRVALWWRSRDQGGISPLTCVNDARGQADCCQGMRRLTIRRRQRLAEAIAGSNRAVTEVAAEYGVAWHTAHRALVAASTRWLGPPAPTRVLGIDETRARTVR